MFGADVTASGKPFNPLTTLNATNEQCEVERCSIKTFEVWRPGKTLWFAMSG